MSFIGDILLSCFTGHTSSFSTAKKHDDFGIQEVETWKKMYPVPDSVPINYNEIDKLAKTTINSLKTIPISSANQTEIQEHLLGYAKVSSLLQNRLVEHLINTRLPQADASVVKEITTNLITFYAPNRWI